ncbi:response regulator [Candidatus Woesearchaeota archaeon]|nr:response regulator [Candidatus Woesearchaeota archaeon]
MPKRIIMVVDDEPGTRQLLSDVLNNEGYEVKVANDGEDFFKKTKKEKFDLVILDIMMPKIDGWDVAAKIKTSKSMQKTPIIFLTAKIDPTSKELGKFASTYYVEKPFEIDDLLTKIKKTLVPKK